MTAEPPVNGTSLDDGDHVDQTVDAIGGLGLLKLIEEEGEALVEHLDELRRRIVISLVAFVAASVVGWFFTDDVLRFFQASVERLIFVAPAEAFFTRLKIAASIGLLLSSPVILWQAWNFVLPALFPEERRVLRTFVAMALTLLAAGIGFGFALVYPLALSFFLSFSAEGLNPAIVVSRHLGFFLGTTLSFGIAFQIPLAFLAAVRLGALTADRLRENRKVAVFFSFVVATMMTPSDVISQVMMAVPLAILYEVAVWLAPRFEADRARKA